MKSFIPILVLMSICLAPPNFYESLYESRYDLGLVKPKFKPGDCVQEEIGDEFNTVYIHLQIVQVGKTKYNTLWYNPRTNKAIFGTEAYSFESIDKDYLKVDCPAKIEVER